MSTNTWLLPLLSCTINLLLATYFLHRKHEALPFFCTERLLQLVCLLIPVILSLFIVFNDAALYALTCTLTGLLLLLTVRGTKRAINKKNTLWFFLFLLILFTADGLPFAINAHLYSSMRASASLLYTLSGVGLALFSKLIGAAALKLLMIQKQERKAPNPVLLIAMLSVPLVSVFLLSTSVTTGAPTPQLPQFASILLVGCILYMNLCIVYLYITLSKYYGQLSEATTQKRVFEAQLNAYQQLEQSQSRLNEIKHDIKNQYIVLGALLKEGNIAEAENYLHQSVETIAEIDHFYTNNPVLNYLLNEKEAAAKEAGIQLTISSFLPQKINLSNELLAVVLGNLIDNALQAVQRLPHTAEKNVALLIKQLDNNLLIEVSNPFDPTEETTRSHRKREGLGIRNVKRVTEENGGIYNQWLQEDRYVVSILLLGIYSG